MAYITAPAASSNLIAAASQKIVTAIGNAFCSMIEASSRVRQVETLQSMSDEELAERGIRREDIVRHVFRDALHF